MARKPNNSAETTVLRKLGINERYQLAMYLLDQYRGTVLSCRYDIPPGLARADSRTQLEEAVKVAVVDTIMRHPMMQVGMINATQKTPSWIQLQSLDLTQHIKWVHVGEQVDFEQTVQENFRIQLDDHFPDLSVKEPGWKMTIFRQENASVMEILFTWNHNHFDAMGAKVFHEDFLEMLNSGSGSSERTGLEGNTLRLPQTPPMLPDPIERLKSLPVGPKHLAMNVWEDIRPQFLNRDTSFALWSPIRCSPYKTQYRSFFMNETSVIAVLALCRKNKTTITGLLHGLALIAFASHLDSTAAPAFQASTIIDHRRNLPPAPPDAPWGQSDRAVGNFVTGMPHKYDTDLVAQIRSKLPTNSEEERAMSAGLQCDLWAASAQTRREISDRLDAGLRNDLVGVFKFVTDWQATMKGAAKRKRQYSWLVTNIGVMDGKMSTKQSNATTGLPNGGENGTDEAERWSISRAQFGLSAEMPAAAIEFSPVSVAGGGMCVGASWPDCAVDVSLGERIMADMERWLGQLANQS